MWSFPHIGDAATNTRVVLNGQQLSIPEEVQNMDGSVMVPIRVISQELGYQVTWNQDDGKVAIDGEGKSITLNIGKKSASVDNQTYTLNTAPVVQNGTTLVPIRLVSEQMGIKVNWNNSDKIVTLATTGTSTGGGTTSESGSNAENGLALVNGISFSESRLLVTLDKNVTPKVSKMDSPNRIVIDLPNSDFGGGFAQGQSASAGQIQTLAVENNDKVSQIRYSQYSTDPSSIRIVIDLNNKQNYEVFNEGDGLLIVDLTPDNGTKPTPPTSTEGTTQPGSAVGNSGKKVVVIDAGHGYQDPGAVGSVSTEKALNLAVALKVEAILKQDPNIDVVLTRSDDTFLELKQRVKVAEKLNADLFVSIHANSSSSSAASGTETYYQRSNSKKLAQTIHKYLVAATGFKNRGVQYGNFHVIRETTMPAVLLEVGFISNKSEESKMNDASRQQAVAEGVVKGIKEYLGVS
ncbi:MULTISPECIES: N-acetylmuramoyl-L-alanine amidase family protein [Paenibacillus]|nr:N-acetylmuramoyl-L-alanine amidase family protein [Paenibacillus nuruki]